MTDDKNIDQSATAATCVNCGTVNIGRSGKCHVCGLPIDRIAPSGLNHKTIQSRVVNGCLVSILVVVALFTIAVLIAGSGKHADKSASVPASDTVDPASMTREQVIAEVERLIAVPRGADGPSAVDLMLKKFGPEMNTDPELSALRERAWKADHIANAGARAKANVDRIHYYRDNILSDEKKTPSTVADINAQLTNFDEAGRLISEANEGQASLTNAEKDQLQSFKSFVSGKQAARLPILRREYAKGLGRVVWEENVQVRAIGQASRTLALDGAIYANNANIASTQRGSKEIWQRLRFAKTTYAWYRGADGWKYDLKVPADTAIGFWEGADFRPSI